MRVDDVDRHVPSSLAIELIEDYVHDNDDEEEEA